MPAIDVPFFGNLVLLLVMLAAAYTFALAVAAGRGRPRLLVSARWGAYATCALVALAVLVLAYAFQTHDFRIRYVGRYSDRSMPWWYLVTALWGGQDGSLLWWTFLLSIYTAACVTWLKNKYVELQPYVVATLMTIFFFFTLLMLFAANPFYVSPTGGPADGEGLNPLLQNYWMIIHPPSLYMGFVGWSVPFSFVIAALVTGRLGEEWIHATRKWVLVAWMFLSFGNLLGASWSYEELGWGGYWAWDPVENAAILPWFVGTAFLHSVMVQERYGMLRVWNVFLLCLTFMLTIFGTFLTRSGLISSVHSFAKSDIGIYFVGYLIVLAVVVLGLIAWRLPELRTGRRFGAESFAIGTLFGGPVGLIAVSFGKLVELVHPRRAKFREGTPTQLDNLVSREGAFLLNNWILIGIMAFVIIATTFPLISELLRGETVTVGASYYNKWMVPLGLTLLFMTGVGPLVAWRRATGKSLWRAFRGPLLATLPVAVFHIAVGGRLGFPWRVESDAIYETATGAFLAKLYSFAPIVCSVTCTFVLACIVQEFARGVSARRKAHREDPFTALLNLTLKAKRRYGGYIVHVGVVLLFVGFGGAAYDKETETALAPGQSLHIGGYDVRYDGVRREEDTNKMMIFTRLTVMQGGSELERVWPAKFIYRTHPDMPTTEVAIRTTLLGDLYMIMNSVNPETRIATFKVISRPLVAWIWIGGLVLLFGTFIAVSPAIRDLVPATEPSRPKRPRRGLQIATAAGLIGLLLLGAHVARAQSDSSSSLHAGSVTIRDPVERRLFDRLLCMCGDCQRLPLSSCGCDDAAAARSELRARLRRGDSIDAIIASYRARFGAKAVSVPPDEGLGRAVWAVPLIGIMLGVAGVVVVGRRLSRRGGGKAAGAATSAVVAESSTPEAAARAASTEERIDAEIAELEDG